jgi:hypothetical protein
LKYRQQQPKFCHPSAILSDGSSITTTPFLEGKQQQILRANAANAAGLRLAQTERQGTVDHAYAQKHLLPGALKRAWGG